MLLNVSQLLADNNMSRDTLAVMLTTQHAVIMPIHVVAAILNAAVVTAVVRGQTPRGLAETRLGLLAFVDVICCLLGFSIDVLYLTGTIDCSVNCELTFEPDVTSGPSVTVTFLRYCMDVSRSIHYSHLMMNATYQFLIVMKPLQFQRIASHRYLYTAVSVAWSVCLISNLFTVVDGLVNHSDKMFFDSRTYAVPVVHTVHSVVVLYLYWCLARTTFRQIRQLAKLEGMQARFQDLDEKARSKRYQNRKNLYVVQLFMLVFGTFFFTQSFGVYIRAFRPRMPPTFATVASLLIVDILPSLHYVFSFIVIYSKNNAIKTRVRGYVQSLCGMCSGCSSPVVRLSGGFCTWCVGRPDLRPGAPSEDLTIQDGRCTIHENRPASQTAWESMDDSPVYSSLVSYSCSCCTSQTTQAVSPT